MKILCPLMPSRLVQSAAVTDDLEVDVLYHPDRPNEPGTGAIQSMVVDLEDWHRLPDMSVAIQAILAHGAEIPFIADMLYGGAYGPYWLKALIEVTTAAFMMGMRDADQFAGMLRYAAEDRELQQVVSSAHRLGVPNIEIYVILEERL